MQTFINHKTKREIHELPETKLNFFILFWIFFISCFLGVVVETIWTCFTTGHLSSRQGLVLGPFNLVYGFGGLVLTIALHWAINKPDMLIFAMSMFVGSSVEYISSFAQEKLMGSVSWDYSYLPFNLNGRISLLYAFFWGILGVSWIRVIYPFLLKIIEKIPKKRHKLLTYSLLAFTIFNTALSIGAVDRWQKRQHHVVATNYIDNFYDRFFNDKIMQTIYPDMQFRH